MKPLLFAVVLLQPIPALAGGWYRIGPGPPYGYGYHRPGSYTNVPSEDWPAIHATNSERARHRSKR
jgi:hypothetical protein